MKRKLTYVSVALVAALSLVFLSLERTPDPDTEEKRDTRWRRVKMIASGKGASMARTRIEEAKGRRARRKGMRVRTDAPIESDWVDENGKPWPANERALMRRLYDSSQADDINAVLAAADEVLTCGNPEIREKYVDELGAVGDEAFQTLTLFLSDPDDSVVDVARSHLTDAFQNIDDDAEKAAVMTTLSTAVTDREVLSSLADELMTMDDLLAMQTIVDMIDTGTSRAAEEAKRMYRTITDEEWNGIESAEAWLAENHDGFDDPENQYR